MNLFTSFFKRKLSQFVSPEFWTYQKVLLYYLLRSKGKQFSIRIHGNKLIANDTRALVGMYREIFLQKQYLFNSSENKPLIIDCGANIGIATCFYKRIFPESQIICIEADPEIARILQNNIERNKWQEVAVVAKAAWVSNNEKLQFSNTGGDGGSLCAEGGIEVETMRLKDLLAHYQRIDMLKMDIEGAELAVLKDCASDLYRVKKMFVEFHSFPGKPQQLEEVLALFAQHGFRYFVIPVRRIDSPFTFNFANENMDLQLNLFAYRS